VVVGGRADQISNLAAVGVPVGNSASDQQVASGDSAILRTNAQVDSGDNPPELAPSSVPRLVLDSSELNVQSAVLGQPVVVRINVADASGFEGLLRFDTQAIEFGGALAASRDATLIQAAGGVLGTQLSVFDTDGVKPQPAGVDVRFVPAVAGDIAVEFDVQTVLDMAGLSRSSNETLKLLLRVGEANSAGHRDRFPAPRAQVKVETSAESINPSDVDPARADFNADGVIDDVDLSELRVEWPALVASGGNCDLANRGLERLDLTGDGCLSLADFSSVSQAFALDLGPTTLPATFPNLAFVVNSTGDEVDVSTADNVCRTAVGSCTLRAALQQSNATPGPNRIEFAIPGNGPHEIVVNTATPLPTINDTTGGVTIDGYSQPGASPNTDPFVSNAVLRIAVTDGATYSNTSERSLFRVTSADNVFRGLSIYRCFYCILYSGTGASNNLIAGNWIGTDTAGTFQMGSNSHTNQASLKFADGPHHNRIGTPELADRNVIGGQRTWGIRLEQWPTEFNYIQNNLFGYRPDGTNRLTTLGAIDAQWFSEHTIIGGTGFRERNMFAGASYGGIDFSHRSRFNEVIGNYFGTSADGTRNPGTWARTRSAIWIKDDAYGHVISGNVIVNNTENGVHVKHNYNQPLTVTGNWIGVLPDGTAVGNSRHGVLMRGQGSVIERNIIANNSGDGVFLDDYREDAASNWQPGLTERNRITQNSFHGNGGLGIDILNQGGQNATGDPNPAGSSADTANTTNPNDPGDVDTGVQGMLNHPEFTAVAVGSVSGTVCAGCTVEVYLQDPTRTRPQGRQYLASVVADAAGNFVVTDSRITLGERITALTIDTVGNTSEFAPSASVSGQLAASGYSGNFVEQIIAGRTVVRTPDNNQPLNGGGAASTPSRVWFDVTAPVDGEYAIDAEVYANDGDSNAFWVVVDDESGPGLVWDNLPTSTTVINNDVVNRPGADPRIVSLTAGPHRIGFALREDGAGLASITLRQVVPPPTLTDPGSQTLGLGAPFSLALAASPAGVTFSALGLPTGLTINPATGSISGTPSAAGVFDVVLRADNARGSSTARQTWTVVAPPTPPVLVPVFGREHRVGDSVVLEVEATDANGDPIRFSASGLPAGIDIDYATGVISGILTTSGRYTVGVTATAAGQSDTEWFTWHVSDGAIVSGVSWVMGPGASSREQRVTGTGFVAGSTLSLGEGTTINSIMSLSDSLIVFRMSTAETAVPGLRDVVVTAPNGAVSYCVGCFRLTNPPLITSVTPSVWAPETTQAVQVAGVFSWGTTVSVSGSGVTLASVTASSTQVTFNATVSSGAAPGVRQLTLRHGDQGVTRIQVLVASAPPALPGVATAVAATATSGRASVSFAAPASGGAVLSYLVRAINLTEPTRGGQQVTAIASPVVVPGLTNGDNYRFSVTAVNPTGSGPTSGLSNTVTPTSPLPLPAVPTDVAAVAGDGEATVTFSSPSPTGGPVASYIVRATNLSDAFAGTVSAAASGSPVVIAGLTNGDEYSFRVAAVNTAGEGPLSAPSNSVVPLPPLPGVPTGVVAAAGDERATVSFAAPVDGGAVESYIVRATNRSDAGAAAVSVAATGSPVVVAGLTNGDEYTFTVAGVNLAGEGAESVASNSVVPRVDLPGVPTGVIAEAGDGEATVSFGAPVDGGPVASYVVRSQNVSNPGAGGQQVTGTGSPMVVTGLTNGDGYVFTVAAVNVSGEGVVSAASSAVVPLPPLPGVPTAVVATAGDGQATVSFDAPVDGGPVVSYVVRATDLTESARGGQLVTGSGSPLVVTGLTNGDEYTFTVAAVNVAGEGPASMASTVVVPLPPLPGVPSGVVATAGDGQASVSFDAPVDGGPVESYVVQASNVSNPAAGGPLATGGGSPIVVSGLTNGDEYTFTVTAVNVAGEGEVSAPSDPVAPQLALPGGTTGVVATAGDGQASVSFVAPVDGGAVESYVVRASNVSNPSAPELSVTGAGSPIVVSGLTNGDGYTFTVTAVNLAGEGVVSAPSDPVTPQVALPAAPTDVVATAGDGQASVSFVAPVDGGPVESYVVRASNVSNPAAAVLSVSGTASPIVVSGLTNGDEYTFTVAGVNVAGEGAVSAASGAVVPLPPLPGAPTDVVATAGDGQASVSFLPPVDGGPVESYVVRASNVSNPSAPVLSVSGAGSPIVVSGLTNGDGYTFTVAVANVAGEGPASPSSMVVVPLPPLPGVPSDVLATAGDGQATVSFVPPVDGGPVESYVVRATNVSNPSAPVLSVSGAGSPIVVSGLTNGDGYTFTVTAVNVAGEGEVSSSSALVTPQLALPGAPTGVVAVSGDGRATVSFVPPVDGGAVASYVVRASNVSNPAAPVVSVTGTGSPIVVSGLTNGMSYVFTVAGLNSSGEGAVSIGSAPIIPFVVTGVTPGIGPGGSWREVYVAGSGFVPGARVTIGGGVVVNSVVSVTPTRITLQISVAETLSPGPRDVVVTLPGGSIGSCAGCFTVLPPPVVTSVTPNSWTRGSTQTIDIVGSNFSTWGLTVAVNGTGVTVTGVTRVSATLLRATVTVASTAPSGSRLLTVRNGDQGVARTPVTII
jgi:hypothetical protein